MILFLSPITDSHYMYFYILSFAWLIGYIFTLTLTFEEFLLKIKMMPMDEDNFVLKVESDDLSPEEKEEIEKEIMLNILIALYLILTFFIWPITLILYQNRY